MDLINYLNRILLKIGIKNYSPLLRGKNCNFIFVHINKTGGTSIGKAIGSYQKRHLTAEEIIDQIGKEAWEEAYKFSFVRNPWDKVVSHYKYRVKTDQTGMGNGAISFKSWVKQTYGEKKHTQFYDNPKMFQPQVEWLKDKDGRLAVNFIGKFESINKDFKTIKNKIGIKNNLPHLNKTKRDDYRKYYDAQTKEIIKKWFIEDIETFGYEYG